MNNNKPRYLLGFMAQITFILAFFVLLGLNLSNPVLVLGFEIVQSTNIDLNGDGKSEKVSISQITERGDFLLSVDKISIEGKVGMEEKVNGFAIVDIDTADTYKEIAVHNPGPSDDDEYAIYWYDGKFIKEMGVLSRLPNFIGNGIVLVDDWMGFWSKRDKYVLNKKTRILELIPQEFYYVGAGATVRESLPIYETRDGSTIIANLAPKSKIVILLCDCYGGYMDMWYLIKSETGILGWTKPKPFYEKLNGLNYAD